MAVQCPFCGEDWTGPGLLEEVPGYEGGQCDCGAWWYEGMEDVEDD
jgi:hypothetical protein